MVWCLPSVFEALGLMHSPVKKTKDKNSFLVFSSFLHCPLTFYVVLVCSSGLSGARTPEGSLFLKCIRNSPAGTENKIPSLCLVSYFFFFSAWFIIFLPSPPIPPHNLKKISFLFSLFMLDLCPSLKK